MSTLLSPPATILCAIMYLACLDRESLVLADPVATLIIFNQRNGYCCRSLGDDKSGKKHMYGHKG